MKKYILLMLNLFFIATSIAQVGIGTTSPTAELEINATGTLPALELTPQTPTGTATGQLAVIGDLLYMYDDTRGKWLSIESSNYQFGRIGNRDNEVMRYSGSFNSANSGPLMPYNGTIVYAAARSRGGLATKEFSILVRNDNTNTSTSTFNLVANEFIDTTLNIDFDAGDYLRAFIGSTGVAVTDLILILHVKWRQ